ncbi:hypothetical protein [Streptomyces gilvus]|uniref:hypothetical protein n=1 Tax=Streptomyces gilvus TaxID=2920937 RepID=UPI001F113272|nr:hypothetical protein [Streptomyces sp. CME 23]MCH5676346.1 hypothetical protein [Streptomyces sp. CME 23]
MSANRKRILALLIGGLLSIIAGLVWGLILRVLGDEVIDCVKAGAGAWVSGFLITVAVAALVPFRDDSPGRDLDPPSQPPAPRPPTAGGPGRSRASTR